MRELAKTRGGDCLSMIYLGRKAKLEWVRREGHTWEAVPYSISMGTWCPVCANAQRIVKQRLSSLLSPNDWLEVLRRHAPSKGGELLSSIYSNSKTRLRWRRKLNHEWLAMPCTVRHGTWCPYCARVCNTHEPSAPKFSASADARWQLEMLRRPEPSRIGCLLLSAVALCRRRPRKQRGLHAFVTLLFQFLVESGGCVANSHGRLLAAESIHPVRG